MSMSLYWSWNEQIMVPSLNSTAAITRFDFILRDMLPVTLRVVNQQTSTNVPYIVTAIEAGTAIKFGAKALATYATDADFLFSQATWAQTGTGTTTIYTANIPLNTAALIAAFGSLSYLDCKAEFTILNSSNENELSTQFTIRIYPDVISGSEGVPSSEYPVVAQYLDDNSVQAVRLVNASGEAVGIFKNGCPYVFISSTGLWYPIVGYIQDGTPTIGCGSVGEAI